MAKELKVKLDLQTGAAEEDLKNLAEGIEKVGDNALDAQKGFDKLDKETKTVSKGLKGMGTAFKALGVGLVIAAFDKLREVFSQNQQVVDFFNTTFEALSLAFNDFFNFLSSNVGTVIDYFKGLFDDPVQSLKNFGQAIIDNVLERVRSALDALGFLGDAVVKVFKGDFAGAAESAKNAGKELFDVVTGVNDSFDKAAEALPTVVDGITNYAKSTIQAAKANVELQKSADLAIAKNQVILEQKDREAEKLRQIRDDESKTIEERVAANNKLAEVLDEQEKLMLANADALIAAAQAQYDKNDSIENEIALIEAKGEREAILAQIEGFRSEQLMNVNSLERERLDLIQDGIDKKEEEAELEEELLEEKKEKLKDNLDAIREAAGEETAIGKAIFIAKQAMRVQEGIEEAKATLSRITMRSAEAAVDTAKGAASTAKIGFPQNIPMLIAFAAQAAGILAAISSAAGAAKGAVKSVGGGGASAATPAPPQAPAFNIVGASPENQIAQALGEQQQQPIKAFVVSNEVTNQQALDRNIVRNASLG